MSNIGMKIVGVEFPLTGSPDWEAARAHADTLTLFQAYRMLNAIGQFPLAVPEDDELDAIPRGFAGELLMQYSQFLSEDPIASIKKACYAAQDAWEGNDPDSGIFLGNHSHVLTTHVDRFRAKSTANYPWILLFCASGCDQAAGFLPQANG